MQDMESLPAPKSSGTEDAPTFKFFSPSTWIAFLQTLFDVSTNDVVERVLYAATPYRIFTAPTESSLASKPDLYGPFWIATTALIAMTSAANIERLVVNGTAAADYSLLWTAAWFMYGSMAAVPLAAFAFTWFARSQGQTESSPLSYIQLMCLYGYSNLSLIPVSILCVIPIGLLQFIAVGAGAANSGLFIYANLWMAMEPSKMRYVVVGAALVCQAITYLGFYYVFLFSESK
jgi:hypothetical protein